MRDTEYATEIKTAKVDAGDGHESRMECLWIKAKEQQEIRFSWWHKDALMMRPLDLPESELLLLFKEAIRLGVISSKFQEDLKAIL